MKTALLLLYVSVFRRPLQHKIVLLENTSPLWAETTREKEEEKKGGDKISQMCFSNWKLWQRVSL